MDSSERVFSKDKHYKRWSELDDRVAIQSGKINKDSLYDIHFATIGHLPQGSLIGVIFNEYRDY